MPELPAPDLTLDLTGVPCPRNSAAALLELEMMDEGESQDTICMGSRLKSHTLGLAPAKIRTRVGGVEVKRKEGKRLFVGSVMCELQRDLVEVKPNDGVCAGL